jgi:DNA-binding response OmpR family regulator
MQLTILLIAEAGAAESLESVLSSVGWTVRVEAPGADALVSAVRAKPDLIILDARSNLSGSTQLCRSLRAVDDLGRAPVIAMMLESDRPRVLEMLEAGVDDCWVESEGHREFQLRLQAIDRRMRPSNDSQILRFNGIELDSDRYVVKANGRPVQLTAMQLKVLKYLMEHPGVTYSRKELLESVWKNPELDEGAVTACITRIRRALSATGNGDAIRNVRSTGGYVFEPEAKPIEHC